jgi:hypothetical protein
MHVETHLQAVQYHLIEGLSFFQIELCHVLRVQAYRLLRVVPARGRVGRESGGSEVGRERGVSEDPAPRTPEQQRLPCLCLRNSDKFDKYCSCAHECMQSLTFEQGFCGAPEPWCALLCSPPLSLFLRLCPSLFPLSPMKHRASTQQAKGAHQDGELSHIRQELLHVHDRSISLLRCKCDCRM